MKTTCTKCKRRPLEPIKRVLAQVRAAQRDGRKAFMAYQLHLVELRLEGLCFDCGFFKRQEALAQIGSGR